MSELAYWPDYDPADDPVEFDQPAPYLYLVPEQDFDGYDEPVEAGQPEGLTRPPIFGEAERAPVLSNDKVIQLIYRCREGDKIARNQIIEANKGLVVVIANTFAVPNGMSRDDLIQEGLLGLFKAIEDFDPDRGAFTTYAKWRVRGAILAAIYSEGSVTVPRNVRKFKKQVARAQDNLCQRAGADMEFTNEQIAEESGLSVFDVRRALDVPETISANIKIHTTNPRSLEIQDFFVADADTSHQASQNLMIAALRRVLSADLSEVEQEVIQLRYNLGEAPGLFTQEAIAKRMGWRSVSTVAKAEKRALGKLAANQELRDASLNEDDFGPDTALLGSPYISEEKYVHLSMPGGEPLRLRPELKQTLEAMHQGLKARQIAKQTGLAYSTIRERMQKVYKLLGAGGQAEALEIISQHKAAGYLEPV